MQTIDLLKYLIAPHDPRLEAYDILENYCRENNLDLDMVDKLPGSSSEHDRILFALLHAAV